MTSLSPRKRLAHASFWTMSGVGVHWLMGVGASIAAARILGPASFGALSMTRTTLFTFTLIAGASLGIATGRTVASLRQQDPERTGRVIGLLTLFSVVMSVIATAICLALASPIARHLHAPQLAAPLVASAAFIVFSSISAVQIGTLNGLEAFSVSATVIAIDGVLSGTMLVAGAYFGGVSGAAASMVFAAAVGWILKQRVVVTTCRKRKITIRYRGSSGEMPLIRDVVLPSLLFSGTAQPFAWLARAMLARGDHGLIEVGIFGAAYAWGTAVMNVPAQVTRPAVPILTNLFSSGETRDFRRLLREVLMLTFATAVALSAPLMILSPWVMKAYGSEFAHGALVLVLVAASSIVASVSASMKAALLATGRLWGQALQSLLWGVSLVGVFYLLRGYGAVGLAASYVAAFAIALTLQTLMARDVFRQPRSAHPVVIDSEAILAEE